MENNYEIGEDTERDNDKDEDLLCEIRQNFTMAQEYYSSQRSEAEEDFKFRSGDQWPENIKAQREADGRPCFAVNKLGQFIKQVVNNQKINRPQMNVKAGDSLASIKISKILQALLVNIQENSFAESSYDTAFDCAATCGEGYFRIVTDYLDDQSFDQDIFIKPIDNIFSVYVDPNMKSDFSNYNWAFVFDTMSKKEFERKYPDSDCAQNNWYGYSVQEGWVGTNDVRIAEYFYIDYEDTTLVLLDNDETLDKKIYNKMPNKDSFKIKKERKGRKKIVKWVKTNGYEVLEETVFPGEYIPIIPVFADTYVLDGKRMYEGVIRQAKSPQVAYNLWANAEAELIALSPKAPYLVVEGQLEGHEDEWAQSNTKSFAYLQYKNVGSNGKDAPPPQRAVFDPQINSVINAKNASNEDLKATTGIYDPSLGKEQKEASGIALMTKQRQAEVTSFMYIDNLSKSLKLAGKTILSMLPQVYDNKRVIRIIDEDNKQNDKTVTVNGGGLDENDESVFLGIGRYDISITIGPYGENQRQQAIESMLALMQTYPDVVPMIGDLFVAKQDWPGAQEISERLKIMLPPALQGKQEMPPEIQAQIAQAQQQYEQQIAQGQAQLQALQTSLANITADYNKVNNELNNKTAELSSKERIAFAQIQKDLLVAGIKEDAADNRVAFKEELAYSASKQQGQVVVPGQAEDELVLPGVNDPVTEQNQAQQQGLSEDEQRKLLSDLDNYTGQSQERNITG